MPVIIGVTSGGVLVPVQVDANGVVKVSSAVSSLPTLPAGDNNIGNVDVVTLPTLPAGDNNIGNVDIVTLPEIPAGTKEIGKIQARSYGWRYEAWRKDPLRFGFSSFISEVESDTNLSAGSNSLNTSAVPTGEIYVYTNISFRYVGTVPTRIRVSLMVSGTYHNLYDAVAPVSNTLYDRQGWWVVKAGNNLRCAISGATAGDDLFFYVTGFGVDIAE